MLDAFQKSGKEVKVPERIYYVAKRGNLKGERFVLHRNRKGKYQGGVSRFRRDIEEFDSIEGVWMRLKSDPDFKLRMSPEKSSGPPSLISRDSIVFEWKD